MTLCKYQLIQIARRGSELGWLDVTGGVQAYSVRTTIISVSSKNSHPSFIW